MLDSRASDAAEPERDAQRIDAAHLQIAPVQSIRGE